MGVAWDPSCKGFAWVVGDDNVGHLVNACAASAISVRRSDVGLCFGKFTRRGCATAPSLPVCGLEESFESSTFSEQSFSVAGVVFPRRVREG